MTSENLKMSLQFTNRRMLSNLIIMLLVGNNYFKSFQIFYLML
ncbi:hypothetical protein N499_0601 [Wolbachia pipientis wVitA]|nr:hypothetical protein N499_0601 [Wolbachia pipientis wVitA]